ncbi:conjugal transfer protein TraE [Vibrio alginolyticus]|nr:conjugal transfer protein TraE [Vibrio alginolyticus]MBY7710659.1 conjugal transfer protein TraE [Vibrio alginolyticus]
MIALDDSRLMAVMHIKGIPFESESIRTLEMAFNRIKALFNQLAKRYGSDLAVWSHIVKRKETLQGDYQFENDFVSRFAEKYLGTFSGQRFFATDYYLTLVLKYDGQVVEGESELYELLKTTQSTLSSFNVSLLGVENVNGTVRLRHAEFLSYLLNHEHHTVPLTENKVVDAIGNADWHFGYDLLEIRGSQSDDATFAAFYELEGYPNTTQLGMWDFMLDQPSEFILTQSMIFMKPFVAQKRLKSQKNLIASGQHSDEELAELKLGLDTVTVGNVGFGDYHCSLAVFADSPERALKEGSDIYGEFLGRHTVFTRANLAAPFSFLSALPASKERMMPSPKSTSNLACTWSLHNYSQGKASGNPLGDGSAVIPLKTRSDTLYYFNCHATEPGSNAQGKIVAGHTLIMGASTSGKTTLECTITAFLSRFNPQMFTLDYNRSTEIMMRVMGGQYFTIREGMDTGLNPYQLPDTPQLRAFLLRLTCRLAADKDGKVTDEEERELKQGIDTMLSLYPRHERGISPLLLSIQLPELRSRLSKWCRSENGQYAWCLDAAQNRFDPSHMNRIGFDITQLIKRDTLGNNKTLPFTEPIFGVLFFLKALMQTEGRLLLTTVEEFWAPANFPLTQGLMEDTLKAGRLKNEFMILSSQSPEDAINCGIFAAIIQQTATKVYLPNPDAEYEGAYQRCNVTLAEFNEITQLDKLSRTFLVKQSNSSCFAKLDLAGFDAFFPVISATDEYLALCDQLRSQYGDDVNAWLPHFEAAIKERIHSR